MTLTLLVQTAFAQGTRSVTLGWTANSELDLAGYRLYYGESSRNYTEVIELPRVTQAMVPDLLRTKDYYFALTAFNTANLESDFSVEVKLERNLTNAPPTIDSVADLLISEDTGLEAAFLTGISAGASEANQTVTIQAASSNPVLLPAPMVLYSAPSAHGFLFFRPTPNMNGTATVTVTLDDGQELNNIVQRTFRVTVNPVNDQPVIRFIPPVSTLEDTVATVPLSVLDVDNSPEELQITASGSDARLIAQGGLQIVNSGGVRSLIIRPAANEFGSTTITVSVRDVQGAVNNRSFPFQVTAVNDPPNFDPLDDISIVENFAAFPVALLNVAPGANETEPLTVTAVSSDPSIVPHPSVSYLPGASSGMLMITPAPDAIGDVSITVTVAEPAGGLSLVRTFNVNVFGLFELLPDVPPTLTLTDPVTEVPFMAYEGHADSAVIVIFATSSNPELIAPSSLTVQGTGARRRLIIAPTPGRSGTALVAVTAVLGPATVTRYINVVALPVLPAPPKRFYDWVP